MSEGSFDSGSFSTDSFSTDSYDFGEEGGGPEPIVSGQVLDFTFDFTSRMTANETISTKTVTATVYTGTHSNPSSIIQGAASSVGKVVTQRVSNAVTGVIYQLLCEVTTNLGQTLHKARYWAVLPSLI